MLVACPCAFAIATPSAVSAGIANMARRAVLIKGGVFFELAGKIDTLLVDKTGTLTFGRPKVVEVVGSDGVTEEGVLMLAAIAEKYSEHPLARAITRLAGERQAKLVKAGEFNALPGSGISATVEGHGVLLGKGPNVRKRGLT